MGWFGKWMLALFATPVGIVILAALDSTIFFFFPLGIDAVLVILAARMSSRAWLLPILATAGSVAGAALTFWMGIKAGDAGLERFVPRDRLERVRRRIKDAGAIGFAVLDLIPPPFPFTAFVLAAGALEVKKTTFFVTLAVCRLLRFGLEAALAVKYGRRILVWVESDVFQTVMTVIIAAALIVTAISLVRLVRSTRPQGRKRRAHA